MQSNPQNTKKKNNRKINKDIVEKYLILLSEYITNEELFSLKELYKNNLDLFVEYTSDIVENVSRKYIYNMIFKYKDLIEEQFYSFAKMQ